MERKGFELYNAAKNKEVSQSTLTRLLQEVTCKGNTILHLAVNLKNKDIAEKILKLDPTLLYKTNNKGDTPLHIAARFGYKEMVDLLIKYWKQDVEQGMKLLMIQNSEKDTALHVAVRKGEKEIVNLLIAKDPTLALVTNEAGESPLFLAVDREFYDIALMILKLKEECSPKGRKNMNSLHAAVIRTYKSTFDLAVEGSPFKSTSGCVNATNEFHRKCIRFIVYITCGKTKPLHDQREISREDFLHKMLDKFPTAIVEADDYGWIPLHYAAYLGNVKVVELFLKNNSSLAYIMDKEGMSALHISAKKGHVGVMRTLIRNCPETCELLDKKGRTALHVAVETGNKNAVKILLKELDFGDLINEQDEDGNTAFHLAAINRHYRILAKLAHDRRVDKLAMNEEGMITADIVQLDNQLLRLEKVLIMIICNLKQVDGGQTPKEERIIKIEGASDDQNISKEKEEEGASDDQNISKGKEAEGASDDQDISKFSLTSITIITTVTFAAALQVPGGYNGQTGTAILQKNMFFKIFLLFDSISFIASAAVMMIHFMNSMSKTSPKNKPKKMSGPINRSLGPLTYCCIYFMFFAYVMSMAAILTGPEAKWQSTAHP